MLHLQTHTHSCVRLSLRVCLCSGMQATICRALQNDLPTPKRSAQTFTNTHTRSLTYTHAHIRKQPECTGKNCGKLHEITKQHSTAQPLGISLSYSSRRCCCCYCCCCFYCLLAAFAARAQHNCFYVASFQLHSLSVPFWARASLSSLPLGSIFPYSDTHARCFVLLLLLLRRPAALKSRPTHPDSRDKTLTTTAQYHRLLYTALVPKSFYFSITFCFLFACSRCKP